MVLEIPIPQFVGSMCNVGTSEGEHEQKLDESKNIYTKEYNNDEKFLKSHINCQDDTQKISSLVIHIGICLKGEYHDESILKWTCEQIHREWMKIMLKLFYNILYDTTYNVIGKLFKEYKNIKEILNDQSSDFLDMYKSDKKKKKKKKELDDVEKEGQPKMGVGNDDNIN
ncbi:hypothetical protein PFTANZ_00277, partial [Plasmodium falciparum Tanzania (2000708)]